MGREPFMPLSLAAFLADALLFWRRDRKQAVWVGGYMWAYCAHRDHDTGRRCWNWLIYDSYCAHHNNTCYWSCGEDDETFLPEAPLCSQMKGCDGTCCKQS